MKPDPHYPSRDDMIQMVAQKMYGAKVLNNTHRGDVVEMMVLAALGSDWDFVGLGWHPWDLERGAGQNRVRIQVKQTAAVQLWGKTKKQSLKYGWHDKRPSYFERDNPGQTIEDEGWFCELFIFGVHEEEDPRAIDQLDPPQWKFLVIPVSDLKPRTNSMVLTKALKKWKPLSWHEIHAAVDEVIRKIRGTLQVKGWNKPKCPRAIPPG